MNRASIDMALFRGSGQAVIGKAGIVLDPCRFLLLDFRPVLLNTGSAPVCMVPQLPHRYILLGGVRVHRAPRPL